MDAAFDKGKENCGKAEPVHSVIKIGKKVIYSVDENSKYDGTDIYVFVFYTPDEKAAEACAEHVNQIACKDTRKNKTP